MSDSSLIPERQLVFSPGLAATIGLEEAILLQHLHPLFTQQKAEIRGGFAWLTIKRAYLLQSLPFWNPEDLHRISRSLVDKGVLLMESPPLHTSELLVFAMNEPARETTPPGSTASSHGTAHSQAKPTSYAPTSGKPALGDQPLPTRRSAGLLPMHWTPSEDLLQLLMLNHNISREFALGQLEDFIFYWRERGETSAAWENKFRQTVLSNWRRHQQQQAEQFMTNQPQALDNHWRPSVDALEIMARSGIDAGFIDAAVPEFILYWRERGAAPKELNSKFIQHIRIQWAKYTSSLEHSTEPKRIVDHWQPSEDVFDILRLSHIDIEFARTLLPEFIVYWKDSNQAHTSWNSKFLQHVKYHWAKRHHLPQADNQNAGHQGASITGRTRDRSLEQDLSDTSWAD
ncbi:MAG: DnaT-like ssDNA-binding domain-containing protein [Halioglobus sp.]